jgi:hypothetical protein
MQRTTNLGCVEIGNHDNPCRVKVRPNRSYHPWMLLIPVPETWPVRTTCTIQCNSTPMRTFSDPGSQPATPPTGTLHHPLPARA